MVRLLLAVVFAGLVAAPRTQNEPAAEAARIVAAKKSAVVHVYVRIENDGGRFGKDWFKDEENKRSGAIIDPSGLVLTHWSCVGVAFDDAGQPKADHSVWVEPVDGSAVPAKLVAHDAGADLALVE
ncbi:MAG: hypothetical protein KDB80_10065, partial [Planctomycetes bacterium]|nr:hypothetical protein [Planctomycetota bacterium]